MRLVSTWVLLALAISQQPAEVPYAHPESTRWFGSCVAGFADIDRDGVADFLVGEGSNPAPELGRVWAVSGSTLRPIWCATAARVGEPFGFSIAPVPDCNADGTPDVVVGAKDAVVLLSGRDGHVLIQVPGAQKNTRFGGHMVSAGGKNEKDETTVFVSEGSFRIGEKEVGAIHAMSLPSGTILRTLKCNYERGCFGGKIFGCPDLDGDKCSDLLLTVYDGEKPLAVAVLSGKELKPIFYVRNKSDAPWFGASLAWCPDMTGDGIPEIAVGVPECRDGFDGPGRVLILSGKDGAEITRLEGERRTADEFGGVLANVGDCDGDGIDDLAVSATEVELWFGTVSVFSGQDLKLLFMVKPPAAQLYHVGRTLSRYTDLDGDGKAEFLIGVDCQENWYEDGSVIIATNLAKPSRLIRGTEMRKILAESK